MDLKFGIITVSDSCYKQEKSDGSGPKLKELLMGQYKNCVVSQSVVPDDISMIVDKLLECCKQNLDVVFTTGGTGLAPRDVTPEATRQVITKEIPSLSTAMLLEGLTKTPLAMLSRAVCGIREETLIINLSGSIKAVTEQFNAIKTVIPHATALIKNNIPDVQSTHKNLQNENKTSKVIIDVASRSRSSPYKMISVEEAHNIIKNVCIQTSRVETVDIKRAIGRVLAENVHSSDALPPFPSSIKDGYAVIASDGDGVRTVIDGVAAGDSPFRLKLERGQCVRISTGAPIPPGADAVVQVEDTKLISASPDNSKELEIIINVKPTLGQDIRSVGSDIPACTLILKEGTVLNSPEIGVLAAVGNIKVDVYKRQTIGVISTGNEIRDPAEVLQPGQIRDSNKITLMTLLEQHGYESNDFGIAKDNPDSVKQKFEEAFDKCDLIITTGGVSMGEYDVIKRVLEVDFDANIHFGRVNMKPGKPTTLATCRYNGSVKTVFGLPGNPVSATVTCLLFVIPALRYFENKPDILYPLLRVAAKDHLKADKERPDYQRVQLKFHGNQIEAYSTGNQISSRLNSFVNANGLLIVPPSNSSVPTETNMYDCYLIGKFL